MKYFILLLPFLLLSCDAKSPIEPDSNPFTIKYSLSGTEPYTIAYLGNDGLYRNTFVNGNTINEMYTTDFQIIYDETFRNNTIRTALVYEYNVKNLIQIKVTEGENILIDSKPDSVLSELEAHFVVE